MEEGWRDIPYVAFSKGATDSLLEVCDQIWTGEDIMPIEGEMGERIIEANARQAQLGQRVLGVAFRALNELPRKGQRGKH